MYVRGVDAFQRAGHYFRAVDDNHRQAKALMRESTLHLHQLYVPVRVHGEKLEEVALRLTKEIHERERVYQEQVGRRRRRGSLARGYTLQSKVGQVTHTLCICTCDLH